MKKFLALFLATILCVSVLSVAACADSELYSKPEEEVDIVLWYPLSGLYGELLEKLVDDYEKENPNIHVETSYSGNYSETETKVATNLATGTAPDVVIGVGAAYTVGRDNHIFEEVLIKDPEFNVDDIFDGFLQQASYKGEVGAVPFGSSTPVMFYNKSIIEAAGLDMVNDPPKTWDEFKEVARTAQEKGNINNSDVFYGFETNDLTWMYNSMLGQIGNSMVVFNEDGTNTYTYTDETAEPAARFFQEVANEGIMPVGEHANAANTFKAGNVAFYAGSSSWAPQFNDLDFEVGAIVMPSFSEDPNVALGGCQITLLATDPVKQAAGWDLIKYLTSTEKHAEWAIGTGYLPIRASEQELESVKEVIAENEMVKTAFAQASTAWCYPAFEHWSTMYSTVTTMMESVENGVDVREAMDEAYEEFMDAIDY